MASTRREELIAALRKAIPEPKSQPPRPKVVVSDDVVIRDADVVVSPADPNFTAPNSIAAALGGRVSVRREDWVTINQAAADAQYWQRQSDAARDRYQRASADPVGYGHWGRLDD